MLSQVSSVPVTVTFALLLRVTVANRQCWRGPVLSLYKVREQAIDVVTVSFCPRHCYSLLLKLKGAMQAVCHRLVFVPVTVSRCS